MLTLEQLEPADEVLTIPLDTEWPDNPILDAAARQGLMVEGTVIATDAGWRPVETLRAGDRVLTYQNGFRRLSEVEHESLSPDVAGAADLWPLLVGVDRLGNVTPMPVLPGQIVLCDTDAEGGETAPELVEARALAGSGDVQPQPGRRALTLTRLSFDDPQLVCANYGAILLCPAKAIAGSDWQDDDEIAEDAEGFLLTEDEERSVPLLGMLDEEADSRAVRDEAA